MLLLLFMPLLFEWLLLLDEEADDEDDDDVEMRPLPMPPPPDGGLAEADRMALNSLFFIKYFSNLASMCLP